MSVVRTCLLALVPCAPLPRGWAKHDKRARELHAAIDDLNRAVDQLPDGSTLASAQERFRTSERRLQTQPVRSARPTGSEEPLLHVLGAERPRTLLRALRSPDHACAPRCAGGGAPSMSVALRKPRASEIRATPAKMRLTPMNVPMSHKLMLGIWAMARNVHRREPHL